MKIKIITAAAALTFCISLNVVSYCNEAGGVYSPVMPGSVEAKVQSLANQQIMVGTENGMELDRPVSRAEAVALAMRTFPIQTNIPNADSFSDVPEEHWAFRAVVCARANGWIDGIGDNMFEPERTVSGAEMCKILLAARGDTGVTFDTAAQTALASGLFDTEEEAAVAEKSELTRGDAAILCSNALDIKTIAESSAPTFAWNMNSLMPDSENYCFSPYSIKLALAMLANGADGNSQKEILEALGIEDLSLFNEQTKSQLEKYANSKATVEVSDAIWLNETYAPYGVFTDSFKNIVAEYYNGETKTSDKEHIVDDINKWVNEKTHEKIPTILSEKDKNNLAYLVNALYFKDAWSDPFNENATKEDTFHTRSGSEKTVPFMNKRDNMKYYGDSHTQIVCLPYKDRQFSMYVAISNGDAPLESYIPKMAYRHVALSMPKFEQEFNCNLMSMFKSLGITSCMEPSGDFSSMLRGINEYYVSNALHKTYINIDEEGTEAAAVTAIMVGTSGSLITDTPIYIPFTADKPFTYFIYDENAQEILFLGKYAF